MNYVQDTEAYLAHLDSLFHVEPEFHIVESSMPGVPGVTAIFYRDLPEPGLITAFTYGLSLGSHPDWTASKPELMVSMESSDKAWGLAIADIAEAHRFEWPFCYGTTVNFHQPISEESSLSAFLIFAPPFLAREQFLYVKLPSSTVSISGMYPLYEGEIALHRKVGLQRFWDLPDWDPFNPRRPDMSTDPANWKGAVPDAQRLTTASNKRMKLSKPGGLGGSSPSKSGIIESGFAAYAQCQPGSEISTVTPRPTASVHEAERLAAFCRQGLAFLVAKGSMSPSLARAFPGLERPELQGSLTAARLSGLREAAHDIVTVLTHYLESAPEVSEADIDSFLLARCAPSLSRMRARYWERLAKILRKASITSDEDYRLVSEALSDTASSSPSSTERLMLEQLAANYLRGSSEA